MNIPFDRWLIWVLRRASYKWPARYGVLRDAKVGKNTFQCAGCKKHVVRSGKKGGLKSISLDHITPVVDPTKPNAFNDDLKTCQCGVCEYIRRLFCDSKGLQVLCKACHDDKTADERVTRKKTNDSNTGL
jgi:hypothetical protein